MHHVILGAGAVGGVIGARLHLAGTPVTLVARGEHLAAIRASGLVLDTAAGRHVVRPPAAGSAAEVDWSVPDPVVLLAVKSHQTAAAVADLAEHAPADTPVVCVQNGVANEAAVLRCFAAVHGITVMLPSAHLEPGVVVQRSTATPGILDVGRFPGGTDTVDEAVAGDLRGAGFESVARPDIMAWKYRKLLLNLGNGIDAALTPGAAADEIGSRCEAEGEAVLAAAGIPVVSAATDTERRGTHLRSRTDRPRGGSTWQSLTRGSATEVDLLTGEIVMLGRLHGVPTPANAAVQAAVHDVVRRRAPARSVPAEVVLAGLPGQSPLASS